MTIDVSDVRSNYSDQIAYAAKKIGNSDIRQKIFLAICAGKKKIKTVTEIVDTTEMPRKRVLEEAVKLFNAKVLRQVKTDSDLAYEKDPFYCQHAKEILSLARNRNKLKKFPTKINPKIGNATIRITFDRKKIDAKRITIDDIESFAKVKSVVPPQNYNTPMYEKEFKNGLKCILGEIGRFQDWGGEMNDLFTDIKIKGMRLRSAFSFKGIGTSGTLTPKKMGKHGDQIQRLFRSPADVFMIQYWGQIDESVIEQMEKIAIAKSAVEGRRIFYGVINDRDSCMLYLAYKKCFS